MADIIEKIKDCQSTKELDSLRLEVVKAVENGANFDEVQSAFRKKKNQLKRHGK